MSSLKTGKILKTSRTERVIGYCGDMLENDPRNVNGIQIMIRIGFFSKEIDGKVYMQFLEILKLP